MLANHLQMAYMHDHWQLKKRGAPLHIGKCGCTKKGRDGEFIEDILHEDRTENRGYREWEKGIYQDTSIYSLERAA